MRVSFLMWSLCRGKRVWRGFLSLVSWGSRMVVGWGVGGEGEPVSREKAAVLFPRKISQPNRPVRFFGCPFCGVPANPEHGQGPGGHSLNTPSFSQTYGYPQSLSLTRRVYAYASACPCAENFRAVPGAVCAGEAFSDVTSIAEVVSGGGGTGRWAVLQCGKSRVLWGV